MLFRENLGARGFALTLADLKFCHCGSSGPDTRGAAKKTQELSVFFPKYSIRRRRDAVRRRGRLPVRPAGGGRSRSGPPRPGEGRRGADPYPRPWAHAERTPPEAGGHGAELPRRAGGHGAAPPRPWAGRARRGCAGRTWAGEGGPGRAVRVCRAALPSLRPRVGPAGRPRAPAGAEPAPARRRGKLRQGWGGGSRCPGRPARRAPGIRLGGRRRALGEVRSAGAARRCRAVAGGAGSVAAGVDLNWKSRGAARRGRGCPWEGWRRGARVPLRAGSGDGGAGGSRSEGSREGKTL